MQFINRRWNGGTQIHDDPGSQAVGGQTTQSDNDSKNDTVVGIVRDNLARIKSDDYLEIRSVAEQVPIEDYPPRVCKDQVKTIQQNGLSQNQLQEVG